MRNNLFKLLLTITIVCGCICGGTEIVIAQSGGSGGVGFGYNIYASQEGGGPIETVPAADVSARYDIMLGPGSFHALRISGSGNGSKDASGTNIGVGWAYHPIDVNAIFGVQVMFDMTFPTASLSEKLSGAPGGETWFAAGVEGRCDFNLTNHTAGTIFGRALYGFRGKPHKFVFGLSLPVVATPVNDEPEKITEWGADTLTYEVKTSYR